MTDGRYCIVLGKVSEKTPECVPMRVVHTSTR